MFMIILHTIKQVLAMLCHFYNDFFYFFLLWGHSFCDFYLKHSRWFFPLANNQWKVQHSDLSNTFWVACSPWLLKLSEIYTKWLIYSHLFLSDGSLLYQDLRAWGKLTPKINALLHPAKILSLSSGTCQCLSPDMRFTRSRPPRSHLKDGAVLYMFHYTLLFPSV